MMDDESKSKYDKDKSGEVLSFQLIYIAWCVKHNQNKFVQEIELLNQKEALNNIMLTNASLKAKPVDSDTEIQLKKWTDE